MEGILFRDGGSTNFTIEINRINHFFNNRTQTLNG